MSSICLELQTRLEHRVGVGTNNGGNEPSEYVSDELSPVTQDTASTESNAPQQITTNQPGIPSRQEQVPRTQDAVHGTGPGRTWPLFLQTTWGSMKGMDKRIKRTAAALTLILTFIAAFGIWPSFKAAKDGAKAVALAAWDARKSYMEYCEAVCINLIIILLPLAGS